MPAIAFADFAGLTSRIISTALSTQLGAGTVTLQATNNITIGAAVTQANVTTQLILQANNGITVSSPISVAGGVSMTAGPGGVTTTASKVDAGANALADQRHRHALARRQPQCEHAHDHRQREPGSEPDMDAVRDVDDRLDPWAAAAT